MFLDFMELEKDFVNVLKILSPGTSIRTVLDDLMRARMGALIVVGTEGVLDIADGGFRMNVDFTPQRLVELSKMDGAIILSEDMKKILYSNTLLVPDAKIKTKETGTRHQAAERTAKQTGAIVFAVSERRNKITVYYGNQKYVLDETSEILRRATETLQILEKQKEIFNDLMINLNILEINNLVTLSDVCGVLQRIEIIKRISDMVRRYLVELGKEGIIVSMRLKELTKNLNKERETILQDYFKSKFSKVDTLLEEMNFDVLLETSDLPKILFEELHDKSVSPRGIRILNKTNLAMGQVELLINNFKTLDEILNADKESLIKILKDQKIINSLNRDVGSLREKIMAGKLV